MEFPAFSLGLTLLFIYVMHIEWYCDLDSTLKFCFLNLTVEKGGGGGGCLCCC